jgi:hypothetical protein
MYATLDRTRERPLAPVRGQDGLQSFQPLESGKRKVEGEKRGANLFSTRGISTIGLLTVMNGEIVNRRKRTIFDNRIPIIEGSIRQNVQ